MKVLRTLVLLMLMVLVAAPTFASGQLVSVIGVVMDSRSGEKIIGAIIKVEGTSKGARTNLDGEFRLKVEEGTYSLKITCLGYQAKLLENTEFKANESKHIEIVLDVEAVKGE
ncbi:MAG: carboxypeptidase-like regulatory domain-containing protein, partial [Ignavibacteriota bacterium]